MAALVSTIEVARPQADVYSYVTDPSRFVEWQKNVVSGHMDDSGPLSVGSKCVTTRRIGFAERPVTSEITSVDPPKTWSVHGIDGPIRAIVNVTVEALDGTARSRVTIELALSPVAHVADTTAQLARTLRRRLAPREPRRPRTPPAIPARRRRLDRARPPRLRLRRGLPQRLVRTVVA